MIARLLRSPDPRFGVAVAVVAGIALRWPGLGAGIYRDEAGTARDALAQGLPEVTRMVVNAETHPPGFFYLENVWLGIVGSGEIQLKLPAFVMGILLIPAAYLLGRSVASGSAGLLAAVLAAVTSVALLFSQEARPYTMAALFAALTIWAYARLIGEPTRRRWWIAFGLFATLLAYSHYIGVLVLGGLFLHALYIALRHRRAMRYAGVWLGLAAAFIFFLPWLPTAWSQIAIGTPWGTKPPLWQRPLLVVADLGYAIPVPSSTIRTVIAWLGAVGGASVLLALRRTGRWNAARIARALESPLSACAIVVLFASLVEAAAGVGERYMFPTLPAAWVVIGATATSFIGLVADAAHVARPSQRRAIAWLGRPLVGLVIVLTVVLGSAYAGYLGIVERSGVRSVVRAEAHSANTVFLLAPDYLLATFRFYAPDLPAHGFVHWTLPLAETPSEYADAWTRPMPVEATLERIQREAEGSFDYLAFVIEPGPYPNIRLPYDLSEAVLERLRERYPLIRTAEYPGRNERVVLYVFGLPIRAARLDVSGNAPSRYAGRGHSGDTGVRGA
jgi:dolichyl-phosphate-mannose-protein mannosyltransferase